MAGQVGQGRVRHVADRSGRAGQNKARQGKAGKHKGNE